MDKNREYEIFCRFSAIAIKRIKASNLEEAKQIVESEQMPVIDNIVRIIRSCKVDEKLSHEVYHNSHEVENEIEYKNWGAE
jgi:hypothetical protein